MLEIKEWFKNFKTFCVLIMNFDPKLKFKKAFSDNLELLGTYLEL